MPHMSFTDFVVFHPGHSRSVTDFRVWDTHTPTQTMVTAGILPLREFSHDRAGNRTRDLMISSQRL